MNQFTLTSARAVNRTEIRQLYWVKSYGILCGTYKLRLYIGFGDTSRNVSDVSILGTADITMTVMRKDHMLLILHQEKSCVKRFIWAQP
jgi:hypothetical protein